MRTFHVFDATGDEFLRQYFTRGVSEIKKYREITLSSSEIKYTQIVREAERYAYEEKNKQTNLVSLLAHIHMHPQCKMRGEYTITLTEKNLYFNGGTSLGTIFPDEKGGKHLVLSTYQIKNDPHILTYLTIHNLGHMLGAAKKGRIGTASPHEETIGKNYVESFDNHCLNFCIMQQKDTIPKMKEHFGALQAKQKFCGYCKEELTKAH